MTFNLVSKINNLAADQDDIHVQLNYLTSLAPNNLSNLSAIANSLNNDPNFAQTITNTITTGLNLKANQATTYTKTETDRK